MTPDMKRLCEAVDSAYADFVKGGYTCGPDEHTIEATPEAIVRAVLMALREPSEEMAKAGWTTFDYPPSPSPQEVWRAMIDQILGTKGRRAEALQNLADIDRDLL